MQGHRDHRRRRPAERGPRPAAPPGRNPGGPRRGLRRPLVTHHELRQVRFELAGRLIARRRARIDRPLDDSHEFRRQIRAGVAQPPALPALVLVTHLARARAVERIRSGHQVIEQDAERVEIRLRRWLMPIEQFRRHVERRADVPALQSVADLLELDPGAEIHQDDPPAFVAHHVVRLDVAVHQAGAVHRRERARQVEADQRRFAGAEGALLAHHLLQRAPANQLHPQADLALPSIRAVNRDHVLMADPREQSRLLDHRRAGARLLARQHLQRDFRRQVRVPRPVDHAEAADAEHAADLERPPMLWYSLRGQQVGVRHRPVAVVVEVDGVQLERKPRRRRPR